MGWLPRRRGSTWTANNRPRSASQSRSISESNSLRRRGSVTDCFAAVMWSDLSSSMVASNGRGAEGCGCAEGPGRRQGEADLLVGTASEAARRRRFVVPNALLDPERAEQTIAKRWRSRYMLETSP